MIEQPMINIGLRLPLTHYQALVILAKREGLTTKRGKPNVSAAAREALARGLETRQELQEGQHEQP